MLGNNSPPSPSFLPPSSLCLSLSIPSPRLFSLSSSSLLGGFASPPLQGQQAGSILWHRYPNPLPLPLPSPNLQSCCSHAVSAEQQLCNVGKGRGRGGGARGRRRRAAPAQPTKHQHTSAQSNKHRYPHPLPLSIANCYGKPCATQLFKAGPKQVKYILASANLEAIVSSTGGMAQRQRV